MKYFKSLTIMVIAIVAINAEDRQVIFTCKGDSTAHLTKVSTCKQGCNPTQQISYKATPDCKKEDPNLLELATLGGMNTARCNSFYQAKDPNLAPAVVCDGADKIEYAQLLGDQKTANLYTLKPIK